LMGWDDGRVADCPGPALVLMMGIAPSCQWTVKLRRVMLPTCPTPSAVSSEKIPRRSRPRVLARRRGSAAPGGDRPRRARAPTKVRIAPNDSAASGCRRRDFLMPALDALVHRRAPQCRGEQRESGRGSIDQGSPQYLSPGSGQQSVQLSVLRRATAPRCHHCAEAAAPLSGSPPCGCGIGLGDNQERIGGG
jgi:hypothetical protein